MNGSGKEWECFDLNKTIQSIAGSLGVQHDQVRATIGLLEGGNTIPFIARYRKEATRGLDEITLRKIEDLRTKAHEIAQRKATILKSIDQQGLLTEELRSQVEACDDKKTLEDIYLPFKPKRRTRATVAREQGLQPLAEILLRQRSLNQAIEEVLGQYVCPEKNVPDPATALQGACDIVSENVVGGQQDTSMALQSGSVRPDRFSGTSWQEGSRREIRDVLRSFRAGGSNPFASISCHEARRRRGDSTHWDPTRQRGGAATNSIAIRSQSRRLSSTMTCCARPRTAMSVYCFRQRSQPFCKH